MEKVTAIFLRVGLLLGLIGLPSTSLAHRLDEYLQATLVSIEPGEVRLQINFTPGVAVADHLLARIDLDHDGVISATEAAAYAEWVRRDLSLTLDRRKITLKLASSKFSPLEELRTGWGIIQMEFSAAIDYMAGGQHKLTLKNRHLPGLSVYLFNAAQPKSTAVQITKQSRNKHQNIGEIDFGVATQNSFSVPAKDIRILGWRAKRRF